MSDKIQVTFIQNPWEPYESRVIEYLPAKEALPIENVAGFLYPLVIADGLDIIGSINGRLYETKEEMKHVLVNPGDNVVFSVVPRGGGGGGGGKNPLKMVAMIAVSALAIYAGQVWMTGMLTGGTAATTVGGVALSEFSVASMGYTLTGAGMLVAGATSFAVNAIGGMLINALMPTSLPTTDLAGLDAANSSPTYGWDTGSNIQQEGRALPVLYGKMRVTPPLISKHISLDGDDQYIHLLYAVADGQIDNISGIEINGEPVIHFENVDIETRMGTNTQTVIPYFNDTYSDHGVGILVETSQISTTTGNSANGLGVGIDFRYGLYWSNNNGELANHSCNYRIEYRKVGDTDWILMVEATATAAQRESYKRYHRVDNISTGQYEIKVTRLSPADTSVRYNSLLYFDYTQEIIYDDFTYPNVSLLALKILANSQLSGGIPTVTCLAERASVEVWDGTQYVNLPANKPAWACYDILHNSLYGVGADVSRISYKEFKRWADWTDTKSITSNIYMDTTLSLLSALAQISVLGRGSVIQRGMNFGVIVDKPGNPVQTFTVGNIITDSYSEEFLGSEDLSNAVEMTYWPEEKNYERSMLEVRTDTFDSSDEDVKKSQITLLGCTDTATAVRHAKYMLNCNKYLRRTVSFGAAVEAIACQPGDIIRISHDVPQWGYGGRVVSGNTNTVKLDRKVSMEPGKTYSVLVRQRFEADAWSMLLIYNAGDYVLHEGVIYKALQGSNNKEPGYEEDYWEAAAERIEQKTVASVSVATVTDTLVLTSPWTVVPSRFDVYTFGEQNKLVKEFRVIDIVKSQDFVCTIKGLEYRAEVYEDAGGAFEFVNESDLAPVKNFKALECWDLRNGIGVSYASLDWSGNASKWYVYKKKVSESRWDFVGETLTPRFTVNDLSLGQTYQFLVTTSSVANGVIKELTFVGHPPLPNPIQGLIVSVSKLGFELDWTLDTTPWVTGYDIADAYAILEQGYSGDSYLVKQIMETGTYTFKVRTRDAFGQVGAWTEVQHTVTGPNSVTGLTALNISEFVMLYWNVPVAGTLPVSKYEVRRGSTWTTATSVGIVASPYSQITELQSGNFRYWVAPIDTEDNYGTAVSVNVDVAGPSGYILHSYEDSDFRDGTPTNLCLYGPEGQIVANFQEFHHRLYLEDLSDNKKIRQEDGSYVFLEDGSFLIGEKLATISDSTVIGDLILENGDSFYMDGGDHWELPEDVELLTEDGNGTLSDESENPLWFSGGVPVIPAIGGYEETFDIQAVITNSKISVNFDVTPMNTGVAVRTYISTKVLVGDAWSPETEGTVAMKPQFRYIKVRFQFESDTVGYAYLNTFNVRVEAKETQDWGTGTIPAGVGYVDVSLNKAFVSVENIVATPLGSASRFCAAPRPGANPTTIRVYMFEGDTGLAITTGGEFSWSVVGYS